MDSDKVLRQQLLALLSGGNAHMTIEQAVADFPPESINTRPPNVPYTPWHLLEHIRIAQWDILEFVRNPNHVSPEWPEGYWPHPEDRADETKWQTTIAAIQADLRAVQRLAEDTALDLSAPISHAKDFTVLRELLLVADHNAYHIGEFAILRQIMGTWPSG